VQRTLDMSAVAAAAAEAEGGSGSSVKVAAPQVYMNVEWRGN
jgi:hypothetical protein